MIAVVAALVLGGFGWGAYQASRPVESAGSAARAADAEVARADAEAIAAGLEAYRAAEDRTYPNRLFTADLAPYVTTALVEAAEAEGETLTPAEADLGSEVVWVWTNRARTRLRFCVGRGFSHASWDSRTGTVVAKRRPKCPQTPSGARIDLDQLSTRWLR